MQKKFYQKASFKLILILLVAVLMIPLSTTLDNDNTKQNPKEYLTISTGDTVINGMDIVDEMNIRRVPTSSNLKYLITHLKDAETFELINAIFTGTIRPSVKDVTHNENISKTGIVTTGNAPYILNITNDSVVIKSPTDFVWGYKQTSIKAKKIDGGIEIINISSNKTIKTVQIEDLNNDSIYPEYRTLKEVKDWYNYAKIGNEMSIKFDIVKFNDGRNNVSGDKVKELFGDDVFTYFVRYANGNPITVYLGDYETVDSYTAYTYLGSHPEYNNAKREYNAKSFVRSWNGTMIPANTSSSSKMDIDYTAASDGNAPGGSASHGVCPSARTLRSVTNQAGFALPTGLVWDEDAVLFGYNPSTDIRVTNNGDYLVKITMWTEGSGTGMKINAKLDKLKSI